MVSKKTWLWVLLVAAGCGGPHRSFQKHVDYLASDRLQGRGVGTEGIELAADYIAAEFAKAGLSPGGDDGTYFQEFSLTLHRKLTGKSTLEISGDLALRKEGVDFIPLSFSSDAAFSGEAAFCGYGIVSSEKNYDDFAGVDVQDKVVVIFDGEPGRWTAENNDIPTRYSMLRDKVYNAKDRGAVAIIVLSGDEPEGPLPEFSSESMEDYGIPAFQVTREMAKVLFIDPHLADWQTIKAGLDEGKSSSFALGSVRIRGQAVLEKTASRTRNVIGKLPGRGPLADEWVVIGAHYDHLGVRKPMLRRFKAGKLVQSDAGPQIHNGADDNASGVAGLIEIAKRFQETPPNRSILFIAFTAEEAGLHGSKYYVEHPVAPLSSTVAMLNMDMIGRLKREASSSAVARTHGDSRGAGMANPHGAAMGSGTVVGLALADGRVQVFGMDTGTGLQEAVMEEAQTVWLAIAPGVDEGGRSDHASFLRKEIPSLHFFSGNHADYHQPSDDSHKINAEGGARIARLVHGVALRLANAQERPRFQLVKREKKQPAGGVTRFRVVMGLTPNYADDDVPGMLVDAVSPEGPADLAGMKGGDRILSISGKPISNVYDYMAATRNNNPGDTVEVIVQRGESKHTLKVTLAGAK